MRIACPECNAVYDVPPTQLAPGRPARCARCGAVWTPVATEDARPPIPAAVVEPRRPTPATPAPAVLLQPGSDLTVAEHDPDAGHLVPPLPEPGFDDVADPVQAAPPVAEPPSAEPPATRRRKGVPVLVGWVLTAAVLVVLGALAVSQGEAIVAAWPPAERAYRAVGLMP